MVSMITDKGLGHQFITLTINISAQHGGREALRREGLSAGSGDLLYISLSRNIKWWT